MPSNHRIAQNDCLWGFLSGNESYAAKLSLNGRRDVFSAKSSRSKELTKNIEEPVHKWKRLFRNLSKQRWQSPFLGHEACHSIRVLAARQRGLRAQTVAASGNQRSRYKRRQAVFERAPGSTYYRFGGKLNPIYYNNASTTQIVRTHWQKASRMRWNHFCFVSKRGSPPRACNLDDSSVTQARDQRTFSFLYFTFLFLLETAVWWSDLPDRIVTEFLRSYL